METRTPGSEGGPGKPTGDNPGRASRPDPTHLRHKSNGGETSTWNCVLVCQYHHDVAIHRRGWRLVLHPDATTTAYGPHGQVLHSHGPPASTGPPSTGPPGSTNP